MDLAISTTLGGDYYTSAKSMLLMALPISSSNIVINLYLFELNDFDNTLVQTCIVSNPDTGAEF